MQTDDFQSLNDYIILDGFVPTIHGDCPVVFHAPDEILVAHSIDEALEVIRSIEGFLEQGKYAVGYFSYEVAAGFGLPVKTLELDSLPMAWVAIYSKHNAIPLPRGFFDLIIPYRYESILERAKVSLNISKDEYVEAVRKIKELIGAGDTYQVNLTCKATIEADIEPLPFFAALARSHPVPYSAYIDGGEWQILSISPELFLNKKERAVESMPMKGTMKRGKLLSDDQQISERLHNSRKNRAENVMIVDMMRNDLGRICDFSSINVPHLFTVETYRSLFQMTSTVRGTLREDVSLPELFAATFPASSITGAPKHRTMEIIRDLERDPRGVYTGAIGVFSPNGDFTLNVAIRTLVHRNGVYELGIGSGIVWDSDPEKEFAETLLKSHFAASPLPQFHLIETLLLDSSKNYSFLEEHLERLQQSAQYWGYAFKKNDAMSELNKFLSSADHVPVIVRLSLGDDGAIAITPRELAEQTTPLTLMLSDCSVDSDNRFLRHKTSNRSGYDEQLKLARKTGAFDTLFTNEKQHVTECAITNIFFKKGDQWFTPSIEDGLLPGIWRGDFLAKHDAHEASIPVSALGDYEQIVVGNSVRGTMAVKKIVNATGETVWEA